MNIRYFAIFILLLGLSFSALKLVSGHTIQATAPFSLLSPLDSGLASAAGDDITGAQKGASFRADGECRVNADINGDGSTNVADIQSIIVASGRTSSDAEWDPAFDLDRDDIINTQDMLLSAAEWRIAFAPCLEVEFTSPDNLSLFNHESIMVTGHYTAASDASVMVVVNDVIASVNLEEGTFTAEVEMNEGGNTVTAVARNMDGNTGSASIQVNLDTTAPRVLINSPEDGSIVHDATLNIRGLINDIVVGTVNSEQAQVTVNGTEALVANRNFLLTDVTLSPGENVITAVGTDQAGNMASTTVKVTLEPIVGKPQIKLMAGNNQSAAINSQLNEPLLVALSDADGNPVADETVIFKVTENNGTLSDGTNSARSLAVTTDANGQAQVSWTLGSRSGVGNNVVEASAVGYAGKASFTAIAEAGEPAHILLDRGSNQPGMIGQPLPNPFVAVVTDEGYNRLSDVPVGFSVLEGGSTFENQSVITVTTDSDGRALGVLTLGPEVGFDNHVVQANFTGNQGSSATFVASGMVAGHPDNTSISGVILDNTDQPIANITVRLKDDPDNRTAQTDAQGQFVIESAPVGNVHLIANSEGDQHNARWPSLEFELVTIAGRDNTIGMPIYLLELDTENQLCVSETEGGTLESPDIPGFSLTVLPGSATFKDGSKEGCITVTRVHADKMPMAPQFGQQPRLAITIQPHGTEFDQPAALSLPNTDGLAPGTVTEMYSFDHDLEQFVAIGTGTVSHDGMTITSDPGMGVIKAGWHCGGTPVPGVGTTQDVALGIIMIDIGVNLTKVFATGSPDAVGTPAFTWSVISPSTLNIAPQPSAQQNLLVLDVTGLEIGANELSVTYTCDSGASITEVITITK